MTANPALADLQFLTGAWDVELSEASFLADPTARLPGSIIVEWIERGAAMVMRTGRCRDPNRYLDLRPG
jgi:hypothetical protein